MSAVVSIEPVGADAAVSRVPRARNAKRTRWWVELLAVAWLLWIYDSITNLAPLRLQSALAHAESVLGFEQALHIDPEHALDHWLAGHHTLGLLVSDYYDNAHFFVTLGLLGWIWWRRADLYRPLRNALVLVNLIGFAVFWLYPVAPPRMLGGFVDVVVSTHAFGSSLHVGALAAHADELAAMPSLHIAWAAWCALVLWRLSARRWVRALALVYPCLTAFAVLATGNHFVLDIVGGLAVTALALAGVRLLQPLPARVAGTALPLAAGVRARLRRRHSPGPAPTPPLAGVTSVDVVQSASPRPRGACHKLVTKSETG